MVTSRQRLLLMNSGEKFLFRDDFPDSHAAGSVNGTRSNPGPGTRTVTDTGSQLSIAGDHLVALGTAPANDNPDLNISGNIVRVAGMCGAIKYKTNKDVAGMFGALYMGFHAPGFINSHFFWSARYVVPPGQPGYVSGLIDSGAAGIQNSFVRLFSETWLEGLIRIRATGCAYYVNQGNGYRLIYIQNLGANTPLWFGVRAPNALVHGFELDYLKFYRQRWVQQARISDSFNRADGAAGVTDGLACEEGGGAGYTWTDTLGTLEISGNTAAFSALTAGVGLCLLEVNETNTYFQVKITRAAGNVGIVFKYVDANNYLLLYYDGANLKLDRVLGGVTTNVHSRVAAYVVGGFISVSMTELAVFTNYSNANSTAQADVKYPTLSFPPFGTKIGLYSTDLGNTFDDLSVFDTYVAVPFKRMDFPGWSAFGDSLMDQNGSGQLRRRLQMAGHMFAVRDYGVGGQSTTNGLVRFASNVLAKPDGIISIQMGVNDLWGAGTPAGANTVIANLQTMYTAAKAAGKTVVAISLYPCKGSVSYDANVQANIDLINAWIADSVTGATDVDFRIDAYTVLEDPANPDTLLPAYDDGGHLHLSQDGYIAVADAIIAQVFV